MTKTKKTNLNKMHFLWNKMILKDKQRNKNKTKMKRMIKKKIKMIQMKKCHRLTINQIINYGMIKCLKKKKVKMKIKIKEIRMIQILKDNNLKIIWNKEQNNKKKKNKIKEILIMSLKNVV